MVEKRTLAFAALAVLVWALLTTSFMAYYYIQQLMFKDQLSEKQRLLTELTESYDEYVTKRNTLSADYGALLGEYQFLKYNGWFSGENQSVCISGFRTLLSSLKGNYTIILSTFPELNETFYILLNEFEALNEDQITEEKFGMLLDRFYTLFGTLAIKELEDAIGKTSEIRVNLCINYTKLGGNVQWHNVSISSCATLFDLTRKVSNVTYSYFADIEPGHVIITSINNQAAWWLWYYWDETVNDWVWGPVGCDAWTLKNGGTYKWDVYP